MNRSHLKTGLAAAGSFLAIGLLLLLLGKVLSFLASNADVIRVLFVLGLLGGVYLMPSITAAARKHRNGGAICALNILLGWTFIGWCVAFVWALTDHTRP